MTFVEFRTPRLAFRGFEIADIPALVDLAGHKEIAATTLSIPHPYTEDDALRWVYNARNPKEDNSRQFSIRECWKDNKNREQEELVGSIGYGVDKHRRAVVGYWIGRPWWGKGYATEALGAVIKKIFSNTDALVVKATHFVSNDASGRVMEKNGMKFEGVLRSHYIKDGKAIDVKQYSILRQEAVWPK